MMATTMQLILNVTTIWFGYTNYYFQDFKYRYSITSAIIRIRLVLDRRDSLRVSVNSLIIACIDFASSNITVASVVTVPGAPPVATEDFS